MRTRCYSCLCRTCVRICCDGDGKNCAGKKEACGDYNGFRQLSLFGQDAGHHMRVLVACEESQRVCMEFRRLGHEAYSCDIEECSGGHPEWHIQADVLPLLDGDCSFRTADGAEHRVYGKWDMIIAFPPCTHLAVSGARYFAEKRKDGRQQKGIDFFMRFVHADCGRIAIENPVGIMSTKYRRPDQIIQPYEFGHTERKSTCLWLKGLPALIPTDLVEPDLHVCRNGVVDSKWHYDTYNLPPRIRAKERSKTFPGIAKAMAEQWGKAGGSSRPKCQTVPRHSWEHYGISRGRYMELIDAIQSGKYAALASKSAHAASETIEEYILLSVKENMSYEGLEKMWACGEIDRIPYCRTDFYGIRRYFFAIMNEKMKELGL